VHRQAQLAVVSLAAGMIGDSAVSGGHGNHGDKQKAVDDMALGGGVARQRYREEGEIGGGGS